MTDIPALIEELRAYVRTAESDDEKNVALVIDRAAAALTEQQDEIVEWSLEAERRGMPIENAKRLYAAEARVAELTEALEEGCDFLERAACRDVTASVTRRFRAVLAVGAISDE